jgi:hypothetical protein
LIADNVAIFDCVGTVQENCANFSRCCKSLGHEELARPTFEFVRAEFAFDFLAAVLTCQAWAEPSERFSGDCFADHFLIAENSGVDVDKCVSHYQFRIGPSTAVATALREIVLQQLTSMRGLPNAAQAI